MSEQEKQRAKFNVSGMVQGVGFRYFVYKNSKKLGLSGYAKNEPDGSVHVVAEGEKKNIDILHELLREGPPSSRVENVTIDRSENKNEFNGFEIY